MRRRYSHIIPFLKNTRAFLQKTLRHLVCVIQNRRTTDQMSFIRQQYHQEKKQAGEKQAPVVAIFFNLEHIQKSAITDFSVKTFCRLPGRYHVFTTFLSTAIANHAILTAAKMLDVLPENLRIFDVADYAAMDAEMHYDANIFVLGDSPFNLVALEAAIQLRAHYKRNYLYFHDGLYTNLVYAWVTRHHLVWQEFTERYYPFANKKNDLTTEDLLKDNIRMIRPVIQLTGITKIIVNAENCIPIITHEVEGIANMQYIRAWLPVPDYRHVQPVVLPTKNGFVVAHFGIPNAFKHVDILVQAVALLRQQQDVKLLLAGYGVKKYVKSLHASQQAFILCEESPTADRLLSLMKGADVTVQLRWPTLGQASGVVSEMLGLGLKCITTTGFMNSCFNEYAVELPAHVAPETLADTILKHLGSMMISPNRHLNLLEQFSWLPAATFIFDQTTQPVPQKNSVKTDIIVSKHKPRILYGASHRILRYEEVPLFIAAGFEVIPVRAHWEIFKVQEPGADDPAHPLYPNWRETCTIPDTILEKIQAIDILKYQNLDAESGLVSAADAALLNEWIDIIYIPNLLPTVPRVLSWFRGLTLFRVYGEGKIMTYDEWAASSGADLALLRKYDARYATLLMLYALNGPEHESILGTNVFHVGPCITRSRIVGQWKGEASSKICNTALSYIYENPHWTEMYLTFCEAFKDMPLRFLGKNDKSRAVLKDDTRVTGLIQDDQTYLELLTDCRCLIDPGTSPFHTHYTPLEAIIMGIPVIFLESSGMAQEILRVIPKKQLENCGICRDFAEARIIMQRCLDDIDYAKMLSANQRIIADKMFSPASVLEQIKEFAAAAPALISAARTASIHDDKPMEYIAPSFKDHSLQMFKKIIKKILRKIKHITIRIISRENA